MSRRPESDKLIIAIRIKRGLLQWLERAPLFDWPRDIASFVGLLRQQKITDRAALLMLFTDLAEELRQLLAARDPAYAVRDFRLSAFWKASRSSVTIDELLTEFERELVGWLNRSAQRQRQPSEHVRRVKEFVREHYSEPLTIESIAQAVGRQQHYVANLFHHEAGLTIHEYLTAVRLHRAWDLIRHGEKIEAVTLLVGYRSKKNFYRQFKAHVGVPPGKCRKPEVPQSVRDN